MSNYFLKVNKELFKQGLNPIELLVLSQIIEFNNNTGDCFISDKAMAENFGVSEKTISRTVKALEEKGYIKRNTTNSQKGKERHIVVIERATDKLSVADEIKEMPTDNLSVAERTICPLRHSQNDLIKDKFKRKEETDNIGFDDLASLRSAEIIKPMAAQEVKSRKPSTEGLTKSEMVARFREEYGF